MKPVDDKKLMRECSRLWKKGCTVSVIADSVWEEGDDHWRDLIGMSGLIRTWRKYHPNLFPPRHKKHAPRRSKTSFDITLRFDAEKYGKMFSVGLERLSFDQLTKKQRHAFVRNCLLWQIDGMLAEKFTEILSIK